MTIDTNNLVSIAEASEDFRRVARMVDETGSVVILMNNTPRYIIKEFASEEADQTISDEDLLKISDRLIERNREAYEVLAK